jgi:hypothetical protein
MIIRGDCLACTKLGKCQTTSVDRVLEGFTCWQFDPAPEPVAMARWNMMQQVGEKTAVRAMVAHITEEEETDD